MASNRPSTDKIHGGRHCAVVGCANGQYRLNKWRKTECKFHEGSKQEDCPCLRPFSLHSFPLANGVPKRATPKEIEKLEENRRKWIAAVYRKGWAPSRNSVICSQHFIDHAPTVKNPIPQLHLGYERIVKEGRKAPSIRTSTPLPSSSRKRKKISLDFDFEAEELDSENEMLMLDADAAADLSIVSEIDILEDENNNDQYTVILDNNDINSSSCDQCENWKRSRSQSDKTKKMVSVACQWENVIELEHSYSADPTVFSKTNNVGIQVNQPDLMFEDIDKKNCRFYTGIMLSEFQALTCALVPFLAGIASGPVRKCDIILFVLMRIRLGLLLEDAADRFKISKATGSKLFRSACKIMAREIGKLVLFLPTSVIKGTMPKSFQNLYPKTTVIIDCSEVFIQRPKKLVTRAKCYSDYKSHNTGKVLIGVAPSGYIMFISDVFGGRASDKYITNQSGFYEFIRPGDQVMADRGFCIDVELRARKATLNIPYFTKGKKQLRQNEVVTSRRIASVRIHVERAISRWKVFRLLKITFPNSMISVLNDICRICAGLCNLLPPLISEKKKTHELL